MIRRVLPATAFAAGVLVVGCFELSAPPSELAAISPIRSAWPSVVEGDLLRDAAKGVAPLQVDAYDGDGNLVTDATIVFVVLDTGLRVEANGTVHGLNVRETPARVVAQVRRGGAVLQTPDIGLDVVPRPDSVAPTPGDTTFAEKPVPVADPSPIPSDPLTIKVLTRGAESRGVRSWIVRYDIVAQPRGTGGQRTALFSTGGSGGIDTLSFDTTDASGAASRTVILQRARLEASSAEPQAPIEVRVRATIRGAGENDPDRVVTFVLPFVRP